MKEFLKNSLPYFRRYLPVLALSMACGLMTVFVTVSTPQIVSLLVDRVLTPLLGGEVKPSSSIFSFLLDGVPQDDYTKIFFILAGTLLVGAALFLLLSYGKWYIGHNFTLKAEGKLRSAAIRKIGSASAPLRAKYTSGDLILIATNDPKKIRDVYVHNVQFLLNGIFYAVLAAAMLGQIHWQLLFLPLAGGCTCAVIVYFFRKKIGRYYDRVWKDSSRLATTVQESIYGARTVASFAREEERRLLFGEDNRRLLDTNLGGVNLFARRNLCTQIVRTAVFIGSLVLAVWLGIAGEITAGEFTAVMGYLGTLMWQFTSVLINLNNIQSNLVSGRRFFGFLNDPDEVAAKYGHSMPSTQPSISFRGVSVRSGEEYALRGVDLELPYGKKLGVMGRTGSGKTLLCKLMQGLAECDEGEILMDGKPLHDHDRNELLRSFSYAMQDVFLFSNTIAANIALYDPFAPEEQIFRAGALAEVDEFARRFPDGYLTTIGEKGFGLSGGQKQRISIARALFKNASVLVFDDVTSALDLETEHRIFRNLARECGTRTLVVVTHRATALKDCDEILFLDAGRIVERGTFDELMAMKGNFAEIYERQKSEMVFEGQYAE